MHGCRKHTVKLERDKAAEKGYNFMRCFIGVPMRSKNRCESHHFSEGYEMPHVQITWVEGRSPEQKRNIAAQVTQILETEGSAKRENIHVAFLDVPATNYAEAGITVADQKRTP